MYLPWNITESALGSSSSILAPFVISTNIFTTQSQCSNIAFALNKVLRLLFSYSPQTQSPSFSWDQITSYEADLEESTFTFLYGRGDGKEPRWVKVFSPYVSPGRVGGASC